MPTDMLRARHARSPRPAPESRDPRDSAAPRMLRLSGRAFDLVAELVASPTADRLWAALPLNSTIEPWGEAVHFEVPVASGRERGARISVTPGDICYWPAQQRIIVAFGPTPISRVGEVRMPEPVNVVARVAGDAGILRSARAGERVSLGRLSA